MHKLKKILAPLALAVFLASVPQVSKAQTIGDVVSSNADFSTLATALQAAGLLETLKGPGPFTVFAPNNAAFAKLPPGTVEGLLADTSKLQEVLLYHVAAGRLGSGDLKAGKLVTLQGAAATIDLSMGVKIDGATVTSADVGLANGIVHVIDSVILPAPSIVDIAAGNPDFSTLVTAVQAAGLVDALKGPGPFTVFAPNNTAFAKVPPATLEWLLANPAQLREVLLYHVSEGRKRSTDLQAGKLPTLLGPASTVTLTNGVRINNSTVIAADAEAGNGVIHVIDSVMLPPGRLSDIALNPQFQTLSSLVIHAGLYELLKGPGPITIFAPNDEAFAKVPAETVQALLADTNRLKEVLLYHMVPGRVRSTDLQAGKVITLQGASATISLTNGVKINSASVTTADEEVINGVIHIIDNVILPPPSLVEIAASNPDFSTLVTAVQAAGLVEALGRSRPLTVFAPNNAAFAKLPPGTLEGLLADTNKLRQVLLYHLAGGRVRAADLEAGKLVTVQGAAATVSLTQGVKIDNASVLAADVEAANGIIHVIDTVILPPPTIVELLANNPDFSTLATAAGAAGLIDLFSGPGPFTVFAPNNAAFAKLPPGTVEALLQDTNRLRHILLYHVNHGPRLRSADLVSGNVPTMHGAPLRVALGQGVNVNQAGVIAADVEASNGVVHVIDEVVLPSGGFAGFSSSIIVKNGKATVVWPVVVGQRQALETATSPAGPWTPLAAMPVTSDGVSKVELDAVGAGGFFRVRSEP